MTWFGRAAQALQKFDPTQPRAPDGKWSAGGSGGDGSRQSSEASSRSARDDGPNGASNSNIGQGVGHSFVSPVVENSDFAGALKGISSDRQKSLLAASAYIDGSLGIIGQDSSVIGAWADGAENSVMTTVHNADWSKLALAATMKGALADQKAVLIFKQQTGGENKLLDFHATGDLTSIHKNLLADGLAFHTLVPDADGKGATVYAVDFDGSSIDAADKAAGRYDATVNWQAGRAEFVGTQKEDGTDREQRDDAQGVYQKAIAASPVSGAGSLWQRVHNRWGENLGVKPTVPLPMAA